MTFKTKDVRRITWKDLCLRVELELSQKRLLSIKFFIEDQSIPIQQFDSTQKIVLPPIFDIDNLDTNLVIFLNRVLELDESYKRGLLKKNPISLTVPINNPTAIDGDSARYPISVLARPILLTYQKDQRLLEFQNQGIDWLISKKALKIYL